MEAIPAFYVAEMFSIATFDYVQLMIQLFYCPRQSTICETKKTKVYQFTVCVTPIPKTRQTRRTTTRTQPPSAPYASSPSDASLVAGSPTPCVTLPVRLRGTSVPVSATLAPRSILSRRLRLWLWLRLLAFMPRRLPDSATRPFPLPEAEAALEFRRLRGPTGERECSRSRWGMWYETVGDPNDEESEGGGTDG